MPVKWTSGGKSGASDAPERVAQLVQHAHRAGGKVPRKSSIGVREDGFGAQSGPSSQEDGVEDRKALLLAEKHAQLEAVSDRHDSLVREMFHMEQFVNMVGYDPAEAKMDKSVVFENYKAKYDLVEKAVPGPARSTRRAHTQRQQLIQGPSTSSPITKISPPKLGPSIATSTHPTTVQAARTHLLKRTIPHDIDNDIESTLEPTSMPLALKGAKKAKTKQSETSPTVSHRRTKDHEAPVATPTRRSDRSKSSISVIMPGAEGISISGLQHAGAPPIHPDGGDERSRDDQTLTPVAPTPKFNIKRIKLIVRRPPFLVTHPRQRPPPTKFNCSLRSYLESYTTLDDKDVDQKTSNLRASADARTYERIEQYRRQGHFVPALHDPNAVIDLSTSVSAQKRTSRDHWDNVMEAAILQSQLKRKKPSGKQIAAQIASKIQAYWDGQEARKEKKRIAEEKRLRALAKATIKMVTNEWKKAVFHIREQERLRHEAEEVKRGHEHLDALLDHSGQLLVTQQGDLSRGDIRHSRSRSSSVSLALEDWMSRNDEDTSESGSDSTQEVDDHSEDGTSEAADQDAESQHRDEEEEEEEEEHGTSMLLGPSSTHVSHSGPSSIMDASEADAASQRWPPDEDELSSMVVDDVVRTTLETSIQQLPTHSSVLLSDQSGEETNAEPHTPPDIVDVSIRPLSPAKGLEPEKDAFHESIVPSSSSPLELDLVRDTRDSSSPPPLLQTAVQSLSILQTAVLPVASLPSPRGRAQCIDPDHPSTSNDSRTPLTTSRKSSPAPDGPMVEKGAAVPNDSAPGAKRHEEFMDVDETVKPIPEYLKPYIVAPVDWDPESKIKPPLLLRGVLRPYQISGLEWLASLHANNLNGILADEMGLGKTIQTIALLAHLACDQGIWGPHLIVVPTSVLLNWEMEFKKFLPGFKILSYHGHTKRRKELRQGWNDKYHFNVCVTSYALASRDAHIFKRKAWYYMILDEAHMIKNFKSQRWNTLLMFRSFRRLLLTGTPLQNNLTELWALLQFLMSGANFANLKEFGDWFSNPLEKAIEMGNAYDEETMQRVSKLHTVLRPYLLRRLKRDVEKELPSKYEHLVLCPLSKRQRFLYDEFMSRAQTQDALQSGIYQKIANILMQLRKVCNHPDLFEVRPIVTSFAMPKSAVSDFEIKELLLRRRLLQEADEHIDLGVLGLAFTGLQNTSRIAALETKRLDATSLLPYATEVAGEPPPKDTRTVHGFRRYSAYLERVDHIARWSHIGYLNRLRCARVPIYGSELVNVAAECHHPIIPLSNIGTQCRSWDVTRISNSMVKSYSSRADDMAPFIDRFAFATPAVVALDLPRFALTGAENYLAAHSWDFDSPLHRASVKLQIAFPDPSLLQYDCGKLQELARLLRDKKAGGHRVLIFTQMTRILDVLEIFLNIHGYLYLRLDGATKIEDRQYITERFNVDQRVFCFIASSRSGGVGINLTGADTVVFYDSDFNPQMDRQCEDRAHRIGQIRDVHIYRFVSQHTVEEAMLRKANQKRSLDDLVIQKGEFDWRTLFNDENALTKALGEFEDTEDAHAAAVAAREEVFLEGADEADFGGDFVETAVGNGDGRPDNASQEVGITAPPDIKDDDAQNMEEPEDEGGTVVDYMIRMVQWDWASFKEWKI